MADLALPRPRPPAEEQDLGLRTYLTTTPGCGGVLRAAPEDFVVVELGDAPREDPAGSYTAARVRLRNWETNRFCGIAANRLHIKRGMVGFAGMKDKRAVTEQWFTFRCPPERLVALEDLDDVEVLQAHTTSQKHFAGAHSGNRFVLRVRDHHAEPDHVQQTLHDIGAAGGVPHYFGPQRFGGGFRPITHRVGAAIVGGDLEEAVRLYLGHPMEGERPEAFEARKVYEATRDPEAALAVYPHHLDPERKMLSRLQKRPDDWRYALTALPPNLLQLFVHAHQSWLFNLILSARIEAGLGLTTAHLGDQVMAVEDDGTTTHAVTAHNQQRIQQELDRGRAVLTAPLTGTDTRPASGDPGDIEARVLQEQAVDPRAFRCRELPQVASTGRRRGILQPVRDLDLQWTEGDPVVSFALGRGSYATVVMREVMKT